MNASPSGVWQAPADALQKASIPQVDGLMLWKVLRSPVSCEAICRVSRVHSTVCKGQPLGNPDHSKGDLAECCVLYLSSLQT